MKKEEVKSPCIQKCSLDENRICPACGRSIDEIVSWGAADNSTRRKILAAAKLRRTRSKEYQADTIMKNSKAFVMDSFCAWDGTTLVLNILGKPGANRDAIGKVKGKQLTVSVTADPVAGRATDHMVRYLAGEFGVGVHDIQVVFGRFNVNKQLRIKSPVKLPAVINKYFAQLSLL